MRFTLDEVKDWSACNMAAQERIFKYGQSYSLREISAKIPFQDLMWLLVNHAQRDPDVRRILCQWVNQMGGKVALDAEMHVLQPEIYKMISDAVRKLHDQGISTHIGHQQIRQAQLVTLLPLFD